ncbi:MAG: hypothetical protein RJB13_1131 [Pseudomonadota bacterium]|jgi:HSP20 family protein
MASNLEPWRNRALLPSKLWNSSFSSNFFRRMDRLFEDVMSEFSEFSLRDQSLHEYEPACDLIERENDIQFCLDLPGMHAKDINVELTGNVLVVSGERKLERKEDKVNSHYHERRLGAFERRFSLPENVNAEKIQAHFDSGVLTLTLPKTAQSQRKKINIIEAAAKPGEVKIEGKSEHKKTA